MKKNEKNRVAHVLAGMMVLTSMVTFLLHSDEDCEHETIPVCQAFHQDVTTQSCRCEGS